MTLTKIDGWIIDYVFQPIANRLPQPMGCIHLGVSFLLGSLLLTGLAFILPLFVFGVGFSQIISDLLVWLINFSFFLAVKRMVSVVRPGLLNPLRPSMFGVRLISLGFAVYQLICGWSGEGILWTINHIILFSQVTFVVGLYFIACQPNFPKRKTSEERNTVIEGAW
ncbi:hypothetical protein [Swingsia samuiensis]|uniref:Uncharacterized protein n=1 Tax=Swingsia samuiensis TaxID=1293412 RepID=A0A4Y6UJS5_9PROT|nr:hypothetical protein [Swingsia samuiensis]QDH16617.1 hypothetical protein E3D00_02795 [Swingsia samuiensis]